MAGANADQRPEAGTQAHPTLSQSLNAAQAPPRAKPEQSPKATDLQSPTTPRQHTHGAYCPKWRILYKGKRLDGVWGKRALHATAAVCMHMKPSAEPMVTVH